MTQGANNLTVGVMYAISAGLFGVLWFCGATMTGPIAAALGVGAAAMLMVPTYLRWQFECLAKADELARSSTITTTAAMMREIKEMDYRHSQELQRVSIETGKLVVRIEDAQEKLQRTKYLQRDPKTGRITSLPAATLPAVTSAVSTRMVILDQETSTDPGPHV